MTPKKPDTRRKPEDRHPEISVVTTVYRSLPYLEEFVRSTLAALQVLAIRDYEIVFVDDGSPDESLKNLIHLQKKHPEITIIELSRNYGHHNAVMIGLRYARGDLVFLTDCDLEVNPNVLVEFFHRFHEDDYDVVYGFQEARKGRLTERIGGKLFWTAFNAISETTVPPNTVTERLMSRRFVDAVASLHDRNLFLVGLMHWLGFKQIGIPVKKSQRTGKSTYTLAHRIHLLVNAITSFSAAPLKAMFYAGAAFTGFSFLLIFALVLRKLLFPESLLIGFTFLSSLIILNISMSMMSLGVIGIYLARIFIQVQDRPIAAVRAIYDTGYEPNNKS